MKVIDYSVEIGVFLPHIVIHFTVGERRTCSLTFIQSDVECHVIVGETVTQLPYQNSIRLADTSRIASLSTVAENALPDVRTGDAILMAFTSRCSFG